MKLTKREITGREKDKAAIKLLEQLRDKLFSDDVTRARRAAFHLSWMQEDGLDILKEALFGNSMRQTKNAAVYGLRSMRGRMKKIALEVLEQGLQGPNSDARQACDHALTVLREHKQEKTRSVQPRQQRGKFRIMDVRGKSRRNRQTDRLGRRKRKPIQGRGFNRK